MLGTVVNFRGPVSYIVKLSDGRHIKRHVDHLRKTEVTATDHEVAVPELVDDCIPIQPPAQTTTTAQPSDTVPPTLRRSTRVRTAPDRLTYPCIYQSTRLAPQCCAFPLVRFIWLCRH